MTKHYITIILFYFLGFTLNAQEKYITTSDSVELYVHIKGTGTPCLFVHGGPGQGSYYWKKFAGDFCENEFQMIYLDQRGCGHSTSPQDKNYSLSRMIKDFEEVREALNIEQWMIMGHSFGGILQTAYASEKQSKILGILMFQCTLNLTESMENNHIPMATNMFDIDDSEYYRNTEIPLKTRLDSMYRSIYSQGIDPWELSFSSKGEVDQFRAMFQELDEWNTEFSQEAFGIEEYLLDFTDLTKSIDVPVLYFYGTKDINVGYDHYKSIHFPNMLLYPFEGKHMDFIGNKKVYKKAISAYLAKF